jgi:hypothetical protein
MRSTFVRCTYQVRCTCNGNPLSPTYDAFQRLTSANYSTGEQFEYA